MALKKVSQKSASLNQRLACQTIVTKDNKDIKVFISKFGRYTILTDTVRSDAQLDLSVFSKKGIVFYYNGDNLGIYRSKIYRLAVDIGNIYP